MNLRISILFCIVIISIFAYFYYLNPQNVEIHLQPFQEEPIKFPLAPLTFIAVLFGGVIVYLALGIKDTKLAISGWRDKKRFEKMRRADELYRGGVDKMIAGETENARVLFNEAMNIDESMVSARLQIASICLENKEYEKAQEILDDALTDDPKYPEILLLMGEASRRKGDYPEAIHLMKRLISLDRNHLAGQKILRDSYISTEQWSKAYQTQKNIVEALNLKAEKGGNLTIEKEKTTLVGLRYQAASTILNKGQIDEAKDELKDIIKKYPNFTPAYLNLAGIYSQKGKENKAIKLLEGAYHGQKDLALLLHLQDMLLEKNDSSRMVEIYKKAIKDDPQDLGLRVLLGKLFLKLEMEEDALSAITDALSLQGDSVDLQTLIGETNYRLKKFEEASNSFKNVLTKEDELPLSFVCTQCGNKSSTGYVDYCTSCQGWNSFKLSIS